MQEISLIGLGRMGQGIALSILRSGRKLTVWNRSKEKAMRILAAGGTWADSPAKAAAGADMVIAMLADDTASEKVWLGTDGALQTMKKGATAVECSTLSLPWVKQLSQKALDRGLIYIDCPVTGMPDAAEKGALTLLVGASSKDLETSGPVLSSFSKSIKHFGAVGTGTSYKLIINLMGAVQIAALAEGIAMAEKLGLDRETVVSAIENSAAASPQVVRYARKMAEKEFSDQPAFTIALRHKDAAYAVALAETHGFPAKLGAVSAQWFAAAKEEYANRDEATIINTILHS